jgi:low affinity Fe/Cu permease
VPDRAPLLPATLNPTGWRRGRERFGAFARAIAVWAGGPIAFLAAAGGLGVWVMVGLTFGFRPWWFTTLYTATSTVTFLMVFLIQHNTNRESHATLLKLDELLRVNEPARQDAIDVESRTLHEQETIAREIRASAGA